MMKKIIKEIKDGFGNITIEIPTKEDVLNLKVGDTVMNCFGHKEVKVLEIIYRGQDVHGKHFVGFKTEFGDKATMTGSFKEDRIIHTVINTGAFTSAELDQIERQANNPLTIS